jgi:hypothetical protein
MPRIKLSYIQLEYKYKKPKSLLFKFITRLLTLHRRQCRLSHQAIAEHTNPTSNRPGATQVFRRNLHRRSPYCLQLLSSVTTRVNRLMVATQQVKEKI